MASWTPARKAYLAANRSTMTVQKLADVLGCSIGSVEGQLYPRARGTGGNVSQGILETYPAKPKGYSVETLAWAVGNLPPPGVLYEQATWDQREARAIVAHQNDWKRWRKANTR